MVDIDHEPEADFSDVSKAPEYFVDLSDSTQPRPILLGRAALAAYMAEPPTPVPQIYGLADVLENPTIEIPIGDLRKHKVVLSKEEAEANGRLILGAIGHMDVKVVRRAWLLGLLPSQRTIRDTYGNFTGFFAEIGVEGAQLKHEQFQRAKRVEDIDMETWDRSDHITWGIKFMRANAGLIPEEAYLNYLATTGTDCPTIDDIARIFGDSDYGQAVADSFTEIEAQNKRARTQKLRSIEEICSGLGDGKIPAEIFDDITDEDDRLRLYAQYLVLNELLGDNNSEAKLSIVLNKRRTAVERGFAAEVKKINYNKDLISVGDVEITAKQLGVFDDIWPSDTSYMETLKIPDEILTQGHARHVTLEDLSV